jgi:hypothetical protein
MTRKHKPLKLGRPKMPPGEALDSRLPIIRVREAEYYTILGYASDDELAVGQWCREVLLRELARRERAK